MPRPKKFKVEELARALEASGGIFAHAICAMADAGRPISRKTLYNYVQRHPELQEVIADAQAELVDVAEGWLRRLVEDGGPRAVFYTLDRLGKDRGFAAFKETTAADGAPLVPPEREQPDFSQYTVEELEQLERIYSAATARQLAKAKK